MKPGKKSFYLPPSFIPSQLTTILTFRFLTIYSMWTNQFNALFLKFRTKGITIIGPISYQSFRQLIKQVGIERILHQLYFVSIGSCGPYGDRKTSSVCDCHDLGAFAPLSFSNMIPPFLALEKVPSMKHSSISILPISFRC